MSRWMMLHSVPGGAPRTVVVGDADGGCHTFHGAMCRERDGELAVFSTSTGQPLRYFDAAEWRWVQWTSSTGRTRLKTAD